MATKKYPIIAFRPGAVLRTRIRLAARAAGISLSEWIRQATLEKLAQEQETP